MKRKIYFKKIATKDALMGRIYRKDNSIVKFTWYADSQIRFTNSVPTDAEQIIEFITKNVGNGAIYYNTSESTKKYIANTFAPKVGVPVFNTEVEDNASAHSDTNRVYHKPAAATVNNDEINRLKAEIERLKDLEVKHAADLQRARHQAQQHCIELYNAQAEINRLKEENATVTTVATVATTDAEIEKAYKKLYHENKLLKAQLKVYREKKASKVDANAIVDRNLDALTISHIIRTLGLAKDAFIGMTHKEIISLCMKRAWAYKKGELDLTAAVLAGSVNLPVVNHNNEIAATTEEEEIYDENHEEEIYDDLEYTDEDEEEDEVIFNSEQTITGYLEEDEVIEEEPVADEPLTVYLVYNKGSFISYIYEEVNGQRTSVASFKCAGGIDAAYVNFINDFCKGLKDEKYKNATVRLPRKFINQLLKKPLLSRYVRLNKIVLEEIDD